MNYETILYTKADRIARITLNRPEKLNAINTKMGFEIVNAVHRAQKDREVNVIVFKGAGRAFSSGYDMTPTEEHKKAPARQKNIREDIDEMMYNIVDVWNEIWNCPKPCISQVHGYCLAGGTDFVLHSDIIICSEDAQFGFPPARATGGLPTHMWIYMVGPQWAKYMVMTGNSIDGRTAERIGLVWKAVPADALEDEVNRLAADFAKISYGLLAANKSIVNIGVDMMGRNLLQRLACIVDAVAHQDPMATEFRNIAASEGLKAAFKWRDQRFGDYGTSGPDRKGSSD